jgi:S1-C subfamily serine protease
MTRWIALILLGGIVGCTSPLEGYRLDHRQVREKQEAAWIKAAPVPAERKARQDWIAARVGRLVPVSGPTFAGGRATAISGDGYFLTADHVVSSDVHFVETRVKHDTVSRKERPVRVVWRDSRFDLAIVKVAGTGYPHFPGRTARFGRGDLLFTADDQGEGWLAVVDGMASLDDAVGNGRFASAGKVLSSRVLSGATLVVSDLPARGGMSGAPLVTASGEIAAILTEIRTHAFGGGNVRTVGTMIRWEEIDRIVAEDRKTRR